MIYTASTYAHVDQLFLLIAAAVIGAYMAMNIVANDVANNVGPAVGSYALTLTGAIVIAAIFEASRAIIAGGDVVSTVKKGIIDPANVADPDVFTWVMMGALIGAALWLNFATWLGMPISSTHVALGAVFGVGFLREFFDTRMGKVVENVLAQHQGEKDFSMAEQVLIAFRNAPPEDKQCMLNELKKMGPEAVIDAAQRKVLQRALKRQLVRRASLFKIVSAWIITVPISAFLAALFFLVLRGMLLP
jgi:PiT family inorganic phosphate transporter